MTKLPSRTPIPPHWIQTQPTSTKDLQSLVDEIQNHPTVSPEDKLKVLNQLSKVHRNKNVGDDYERKHIVATGLNALARTTGVPSLVAARAAQRAESIERSWSARHPSASPLVELISSKYLDEILRSAEQLRSNTATAEAAPPRPPASEAILREGTQAWVKSLLQHCPQTGDDGLLRYALCGSLSTNVLACADGFVEVRANADRHVEPRGTYVALPESSKLALRAAMRRVGDIDYLRTDNRAPHRVNVPLPDAEYRVAALDTAKNPGNKALGGDPINEDNPHPTPVGVDLILVQTADGPVYMTHPRVSLGFHCVHALQRTQDEIEGKIAADFVGLLTALEPIESRETLLAAVHDALMSDAPHVSRLPRCTSSEAQAMHAFINDALKRNDDYAYLSRLDPPTSQPAACLKLLNMLPTARDKDVLLNYLGHHPEALTDFGYLELVTNVVRAEMQDTLESVIAPYEAAILEPRQGNLWTNALQQPYVKLASVEATKRHALLQELLEQGQLLLEQRQLGEFEVLCRTLMHGR